MADEGLAKKDRICQFFASNAGLHFRSIDVATALGLDTRSVGQQLARLWRSGFVEKVQTGPFTTWRMKFQTYPGRNLHGPAAPKPACLTQHTPAKKSTWGSRTHEEGRNDSGHCAMGSSVVLESTEGGNQEGEEEEDETEDQGISLGEAHSVQIPEYHSSSSKPLAATRDGPTSTQNISSQCKAAENPPIKKTVGRPPGNKNKMSTSCRVGQKGSKTGKTSSNSGSCKTTTTAAVKRRVGPESFRNADQGSRLKGKKKTSQSRKDCSSRSDTDSESTPLKIVPTGLKRKAGATNTVQGLKKKVKKTKTQTTKREDCRGRSTTDSGLSSQVQKRTQLVPASVSYQKTAASTAKKKTGQEQKRKIKKTTPPNKEGYCSSTCSTSWKDPVQHNPTLMPTTLAPSLNRPSGNMETKLMNFICEAQGMLVMTGDDVAKALGSKPKETHRLLLHMQRTGRVRKVCDKPTRWMMLGQGKGGPARKRQTEAVTTTTTQQKERPSLTTAQQKEPPQTKHQELSTQAYRSLFIDGSPTRRRQEKATTTTQQKEPTKHQVPSTQTYRSLSTDGSTEEGTSKTSSSTRNLSECGQVYGMRFETQTSLCEEEEEGSGEIVSTSTQVPAQFRTCLATAEDEEEDVSCVSQEQDSGFLEDATFYTERKKPSPTVQQASSLPSKKQSRKSNQKSQGEDISCVFQEQDSGFLEDVTFYAERKKSSPTALSLSSKKQSKTSNQTSQVITTTRRCLSPCGKYVKKTPVKKQVLTDKRSVRMSTENGSSYTKPTAAKSTSLGNLQSQNSNYNAISSTSCEAKKVELSNFRIPKKNSLSGKHLGKSQFTVGQKSGDLCGGKRMSVAPSKLDNNLLDSSKDCTGKNTQKDISTIKTPPHILKHSASYFASTTKEPNTKPKLPRPSTTTKDIPKLQNQTETSFVRTKDNGVSMREPLADIDVMVDVTVDKSAQIQNQLHSCGTCGSNKDPQHTPLSVLRRNSIKTSPSGPPKLYPHRATESISKQCMVGTLGSRDNPPILVPIEEELRSIGTESPSSLRAAKRNLYPCFSLEESLEHQQRSTSCTSIHEQSGYKEDEHTGFRRGLVETVVSVTPGSGYFPLTDTDTKRKQQQLTACPHDWLLNKVNDRKIAGRCGGQKNVSGPESFSSEIGGTKESFSSFQHTGTDPRRTIGRGVYAEIQDTSRVTGGEVIGHAGHGSQQLMLSNLHEEQHGRGHACSQEERRSNTEANLNCLEPMKAVAKVSIGRMASFIPVEEQHRMTNIDDRAYHMGTNPIYSQGLIRNNRQANLNSPESRKAVEKVRLGEKASFSPTKQHRITDIDDRAHHMCPVLGAEGLVHHQLGYHITGHTCSVHQMDSSGQGGYKRHLGRQQKSEKVHQALVTSPLIPEGLFISEKREQNESTRWQRPRSPKSFWIDYWSKAESKDTKSDDMKDRNAEDITVLNDSYSRLVAYSNNAENTNCKEEDTRSCNVKEKMLENTTVVSDRCSGLVAYSPTGTENTDSNEEPSSDLMKNCSRSKVCAKELKTDEKSLTVLKQECKIFRTTETQTSQGFAHTLQVQRDKIANLRQDSQIQDLFGNVDVKVRLEEKVRSSALTSLTGPVQQSTWTQPKALYSTDEKKPQEQEKSEVQEPRGQGKAAVVEVRGDDGSEVQEPRGQEQAAVVKARGHDGSEFESRGQEPAVDGARSHDGSEFEPRGQREAAGDEARGCDGSEVGQVSKHQVSVAMVTPQGSRPVVMAAQPSGTPLHPAAAQPVPVSQQSHPIVQLNELCQRNHLPMCFQDISVTGPAHRPRVQIAAVVGDCTFQAEASSKKAARRQAARDALQALYQEGYK
ncbi:PREDICTED: uncharacterized protein LOC109468498 [Branchiostoma belcheri]|uniref:Uncharacterized protein LOC109468498 n=1 Tax=Branchiostoma belcheri TaxID=7741 RepID=A0A6P4YYD2_BRABE|nr:PREDICTED: uncharacterized protein LOC109468498 [Branchiostoma belcheri]